jgi:hypothetical protein
MAIAGPAASSVATSGAGTPSEPELPVRRLSLREEVEVAATQGDELGGRRRLAAHHHQAAGNVVDAVAVPVPGHDSVSVRNHADGVGQPLKVPERRHGARRELHENPEAG